MEVGFFLPSVGLFARLFTNPQFSDPGSRDLELERGTKDKTNHSGQILSLTLKGRWDRLAPGGKLDSFGWRAC